MESKKPQIRFNNFTDDWEQRKLGECFEERNESMPEGELISVTINSGIKKFSELGRHDNSNEDKSKYKRVTIGDIAYNSMRMWQGASGYSPYEGIVSPAYTVLCPNTDIVESKCISYIFKRSEMIHTFQINSQGITSDNWNLKYPVLSQIEICIPKSTTEQKKIASLLEKLDNLITLHQRKYDKLVTIKKSCLGKMFPKNGSKYPEVRFKGFTEAWEQHKLSTIADRVTRKNSEMQSTLPLTISAQYGLVDQITYFNNRVASQNISGYYLIKNGEFAYNKSTSDGYPFGAVKRLDLYKDGVLSTLYIVFSLKKEANIDSQFIVSYYDTNLWHKQISECAAEGARNHGLLNISAKDFFDTLLYIPKDLSEQKKIGQFLLSLDNLITLHQHELVKLKNIKSSCLKKMFV